jgi:AraC family transcriptional regulator
MEPYVNSILEKVPGDIRQTSKEYNTKFVSIFEASEHVIGQKVNLEYYHFVIFYSQPPLLKIGNKEYQFQKRSLIALEPEMDLMVVPYEEKVLGDYHVISINKDFFQRIALEALGKSKVKFDRIENVYSLQLLELVANFKSEISNYGGKYPTMVDSIATQIAFQLLRDVNADDHIFSKNGRNDQKYIKSAMAYMENNFNCNITIGEICREIYVSQAHFERMFKYHVGTTPHQHLVAIRIKMAKELLIREDCSVEQIARRCGFVSLSHFSTVFKRIVGLNPSDYKKIVINI